MGRILLIKGNCNSDLVCFPSAIPERVFCKLLELNIILLQVIRPCAIEL